MKKTPNLSKKQLILSLIKDDLIHSRLVYGFESMGIDADDYTLHLSYTIFSLVGIQPSHFKIDEILENYIDLTKRVEKLNITHQKEELEQLAKDIYRYLKSMRKLESEIV